MGNSMQRLLGTSRITIEYQEHPGYLHFRILGPYDFEDYQAAIRAMHAACSERAIRKSLIDITPIEGDIPQFDRYNLGIVFAGVWGREPKVAIMVPSAKINRFFENTAVNRQARVKVFPDEPSALVWLLRD